MNHCSYEYTDDVKVFDELTFNFEWARDPAKLSELNRFAKTFHTDKSDNNLNNDEWFKYSEAKWDKFYEMILETIKSGNILGLSLLWKSVYYYDRDSPSYEWCLKKAARYGNLKTFQQCLFAFGNYSTINGTEPVDYLELLNDAHKNSPDVVAYIEQLGQCVINGELYPMSNINSKDWDAEMEGYNDGEEFYDKCKLYQTLSQTNPM